MRISPWWKIGFKTGLEYNAELYYPFVLYLDMAGASSEKEHYMNGAFWGNLISGSLELVGIITVISSCFGYLTRFSI